MTPLPVRQSPDMDNSVRRAVKAVVALNLAYFVLEFAVARVIGSVSLFADSVDFLEDASVNLLVLLALGWPVKVRARVGMGLAWVLLVPGLATLWMAWVKFWHPVAPDAGDLVTTAFGAMVVNFVCALILMRHRAHGGSLTRAAFLSARNDVFANEAMVAAGLVTAFLWRSAWPDLLVGLGIAAMNADAAREVWQAAIEEHKTAA